MKKLLTLVLINLLSFSVSALTFTNSNTSSGSTSSGSTEGKKTLYNQRNSNKGPTMSGYNTYMSPWNHAFKIVKKPYPVRHGTTSERYELRYGDCAEFKGYSGCAHNSRRSELAIDKSLVQARYKQDIWYGWSFYNETIPTIGLKNVIGQWKNGINGNNLPMIFISQMPDSLNSWSSQRWKNCPATFCSNHLETEDSYDVFFNLGRGGKFKSQGESNNWNSPCRLWSMKENKGKWVDIVLNTNFGTDENGYANVWINGVKRCEYRGKFLDPSDTRNAPYPGPSHRRGIYTNFGKMKTKTHPTLIAYFDEFRVGRSREEVDIRMIEDPNYQPPRVKCAKGFINKNESCKKDISFEYDGKYSFELIRLPWLKKLAYGQLVIKDGQVKVDTTKSWVSDEISDPLDSLRGTVDSKGNVDWSIEIDPWNNPPKHPQDVRLNGNINDSGSISGVVGGDGETKLELTVKKSFTEYDGKYSVQLNRLHLETGNLKPRGSAEFEIMDGNLIVSTENRRIHRKIDDPFNSFNGTVDSDGNVSWWMRIDPWKKSKFLHNVYFRGNLNDDELITGMYDGGTEVQLEVLEIE